MKKKTIKLLRSSPLILTITITRASKMTPRNSLLCRFQKKNFLLKNTRAMKLTKILKVN